MIDSDMLLPIRPSAVLLMQPGAQSSPAYAAKVLSEAA